MHSGSSHESSVSVREQIKFSFHIYQKNLVFHFGSNILRFVVKIFVNSYFFFLLGFVGFFEKTEIWESYFIFVRGSLLFKRTCITAGSAKFL